MVNLIHEAFGTHRLDQENFTDFRQENRCVGPDENTKKNFKLLESAEHKLYPGCDSFTTLSFIIQLMHIKVQNGWSDTSFGMLVELLKKSIS